MMWWLVGAAFAGDLLVAHGRVWDGTGSSAREDVDVLVHDGTIAAVGPGLVAPDGARTIDAHGATVIPGLTDSHVHIAFDPAGGLRTITADEHAAYLRAHLRAYLACGVTTIMDPAILPGDLAQVRATLASGAPGPRFLTLGTPISPTGGYVQIVIPTFPGVSSPADVDKALDLVASQQTEGVKVTVERGLLRNMWPLYSPETAAEIRAGAAARHLTIYAHAMAPESQEYAVDVLGAKVLVHGMTHLDLDVAHKESAAGITEMTTLSLLDILRDGWQPERLDDPLVALTVPPEELAFARDPAKVKLFERAMAHVVAPHLPSGLIASLMVRESTVAARLAKEGEALRELSVEGVPIVMGSDSGGWPIIPFGFHGPTSVREIELIGLAGFAPDRALVAATSAPAEMLGRQAEFGTIAVGESGDLVVVEGDPLKDLRALRHARYVVRAGEARTPAEWMAAPPP